MLVRVSGLDIALGRNLIASCAQKATHVWDLRKYSPTFAGCAVARKPPTSGHEADLKVPKFAAGDSGVVSAFGALHCIASACAVQVVMVGDALVVAEDWEDGSVYSLTTGKRTSSRIPALKKCYQLYATADRLVSVESSFSSGHNYKSFSVIDFAPKRLRAT